MARPDSSYPVVVKPYKLDISQFGERVRDEMKFTITNVSEDNLSLALIAGLPGLAEIELPATVEAGKSASGKVKLLRQALTEEFEKSFTFQLSDAGKTRFTIPVKRAIKTPPVQKTSQAKKSASDN